MADVTIRPVTAADGPRLVAANRAARDFHAPWAAPATTQAGFDAWFESVATGRRVSLLAEAGPALVGIINISEIVRGNFLSAYLGYYAYPEGTGQGRMTRAVALAIDHVFQVLRLHRLEANIQPANARSIALVQRLGFRQEGFSPAYLHIDGAWRDHERWAVISPEDPRQAG